jgi:hypothetical protein
MMRDRERPRFTVERVRRAGPDAAYSPGMYASKPGDARRQGRADRTGDAAGAPAVPSLKFLDTGAAIEARLGVICVARITINPTGGFLWSCYLPMVPPAPRPAADLEKAQAAIDYKVREWCEAARLIAARAKGGAR